MISLANGHWNARIAETGAELKSLSNASTGQEHIWNGDPAWSERIRAAALPGHRRAQGRRVPARGPRVQAAVARLRPWKRVHRDSRGLRVGGAAARFERGDPRWVPLRFRPDRHLRPYALGNRRALHSPERRTDQHALLYRLAPGLRGPIRRRGAGELLRLLRTRGEPRALVLQGRSDRRGQDRRGHGEQPSP